MCWNEMVMLAAVEMEKTFSFPAVVETSTELEV